MANVKYVPLHTGNSTVSRGGTYNTFGTNTASDISKFTKISRAAAAASDIWGVLKYHEPVFIPNTRRNRAVSCLYYKAKKFRTLRNWPNFYM